jgi:hypothetical protein
MFKRYKITRRTKTKGPKKNQYILKVNRAARRLLRARHLLAAYFRVDREFYVQNLQIYDTIDRGVREEKENIEPLRDRIWTDSDGENGENGGEGAKGGKDIGIV